MFKAEAKNETFCVVKSGPSETTKTSKIKREKQFGKPKDLDENNFLKNINNL